MRYATGPNGIRDSREGFRTLSVSLKDGKAIYHYRVFYECLGCKRNVEVAPQTDPLEYIPATPEQIEARKKASEQRRRGK